LAQSPRDSNILLLLLHVSGFGCSSSRSDEQFGTALLDVPDLSFFSHHTTNQQQQFI
jgi:hypothetical protein